MIKFPLKMLIIIYFFVTFTLSLWSNTEPYNFSPPAKSVKFGESTPFSFIPVGWSKEGYCAFLLQNRVGNNVKFYIFNAVEDKTVYESEDYEVLNGDIPSFWNRNREFLTGKLSQWNVLSDRNPQYGPTRFAADNDVYSLYNDTALKPGNRSIAAMELNIKSENRGTKKLYSYVQDDSKDQKLLSSSVLGYYASPVERRILVLSLDEIAGSNENPETNIRFNGAHLTLGFRLERDETTALIEAVLSGQYYMTRVHLENGENPNIVVNEGDALILLAGKQMNWEIVFLMLEYGAEAAVVDSDGRSLLHLAVIQGDPVIVGKLIDSGLNKQFPDSQGQTPAELALETGNRSLLPLFEN